MKITDITPQKRNERENIYINDKFAFGLSTELRYKYDLYIGKEITDDFINDVLKAEEQNKVLNHAFNILSYGQNSKKDVYTKLIRKGYEEEFVLKAIEYCEERNYINDKLYAESFIKDKTNINKYGSNRIRYDLISKGVSKDIIDEVLDLDHDEEYERALELANKRIKSYRNDDNAAIYRKLGGYLQRRGYTYDIVSKVLRQVLNDLE
ncbi:MAG: hypothetical protein GX053_11730 [Tissierella sp.]|nr:hypothetical protein [Tissierella sp.]